MSLPVPHSLASSSVVRIFVIICSLSSLVQVQARQLNVGGRDGWVVHPAEDYNRWASRNRFLINDSLFFKYKKGENSVLLVNKDGYDKCDAHDPIKKWDDGNTVFQLDRSGPFYFVSGKDGNCRNGQKLIVVVLAFRPRPFPLPPPKALPPGSSSSTPATSPAPSTAPATTPTHAPAMGPSSLSPSPTAAPGSSTPATSPSPSTSPATTPTHAPAMGPSSLAVSDCCSRVEYPGDVSVPVDIASYNPNACAGDRTNVSVAISELGIAAISSNSNSSNIRSDRARGARNVATGASHHLTTSRRVSPVVSTTSDANRTERDLASAGHVSRTRGESSWYVGIGIPDDGVGANLTERLWDEVRCSIPDDRVYKNFS